MCLRCKWYCLYWFFVLLGFKLGFEYFSFNWVRCLCVFFNFIFLILIEFFSLLIRICMGVLYRGYGLFIVVDLFVMFLINFFCVFFFLVLIGGWFFMYVCIFNFLKLVVVIGLVYLNVFFMYMLLYIIIYVFLLLRYLILKLMFFRIGIWYCML